MLEGYIASKFANKYFEEEVFKIIKKHAIVVSILSLLPDLGFVYVIGLWRMYKKVAEKVGVPFRQNWKSLIGAGVFVNIALYIALDTVLTVIPFFNPIISYIMFYLSGKLYVESLKLLDLTDGKVKKLPASKH